MNLITSGMEGVYDRLKHVDNYMKKSVTEPYAERKLTEAEQLRMFRSMTPDKLVEAISQMKDYKEFRKFNDWLYKMEQKERNNGLQ